MSCEGGSKPLGVLLFECTLQRVCWMCACEIKRKLRYVKDQKIGIIHDEVASS